MKFSANRKALVIAPFLLLLVVMLVVTFMNSPGENNNNGNNNQSTVGPVEERWGYGPSDRPLYPDSVRFQFISSCPCTPGVAAWFGVKGVSVEDVSNFFLEEFEKEGWEVSILNPGYEYHFLQGTSETYIYIAESSQWPDHTEYIMGWTIW